jgi:hypothetical protein
LEVVSMKTDMGQWQWAFVFFQSFDRTPVSRDRDCYGLTKTSEILGGRQGLGMHQGFDHFKHGGPVQQASTVQERVRP